MINLNEFKEEEKDVKIFNNGNAGRVKNVSVSVVRKAETDKENAPDFKILYTDDTGGSVNDGIYYPKEDDTEKRKQIVLSRLMNVLHALSPETRTKKLPEFATYKEAIDFLMKNIVTHSKDGRVNVFVAFGTKNTPQQYLRVRKFNFVENYKVEDSETRLRAKLNPDPNNQGWNDLMERIQPTEFKEASFDDFDTKSEDTIFDDEEAAEDIDW